MGTGQGAGIGSSHFHELESSLGREVKLFCEFSKIHNFRVPGSAIAAWVLAVNRSSGGKKNLIVYSLVCIFIIIIIAISSRSINIISSISFVVLLNCLYLNPHALSFIHFSSPFRRTETEKERQGSRTEKKPATGSMTGREEKRIGAGSRTETDGERQKKKLQKQGREGGMRQHGTGSRDRK